MFVEGRRESERGLAKEKQDSRWGEGDLNSREKLDRQIAPTAPETKSAHAAESGRAKTFTLLNWCKNHRNRARLTGIARFARLFIFELWDSGVTKRPTFQP